MDYDLGKEDALQSSPKLPLFNTLRNIYTRLSFNKKDYQELTKAKDNKEDKDKVEELPNLKRSRSKVVYRRDSLLRSSGRLTKKTLKAIYQLKPYRAFKIGNQNIYKLTLKRPLNVLKSAARKSRPLEPPISNIKASNNNIREPKNTPTKASKRYRKELDSSPALAIATFLINVVILFNNKKLLITNSNNQVTTGIKEGLPPYTEPEQT